MFNPKKRRSTRKSSGNDIDVRNNIFSVACLADGKHAVSGSEEGKIQSWRVEDGKETGKPIDVGSPVLDIAVAKDGKRIVSGTKSGQVTVWSLENHSKVAEYRGHRDGVSTVDISQDGSKIAAGSVDKTLCVRSLPTGQRIFALELDHDLAAVRFSPDAQLIATAICHFASIRIYDLSCRLLVDSPIRVSSWFNQSLVWSNDSKQLFVLSSDGSINCLDISTRTILAKWPIHSGSPKCIALANNGAFIAVTTHSSISFWDITTHQRIGSVIDLNYNIHSMAISATYHMITGGDSDEQINPRDLCDILPSPYRDTMLREREIRRRVTERADPECIIQLIRDQDIHSNAKIASLEKNIEELYTSTANLEKTIQELRTQLVESQNEANTKVDTLVRVIRAHETKHQCEALYTEGHICDAAKLLRKLTDTVKEDLPANRLIADWLTEFTDRCISKLRETGDEALNTEKYDEALATYSTALSLNPIDPTVMFTRWARTMLIGHSLNETLATATKFKISSFHVYQIICSVLEGSSRVTEAVECFRRMQSQVPANITLHNKRVQWELDFRGRSVDKLQQLGDAAVDSKGYKVAIEYYSTALILDPIHAGDIFVKRSKAQAVIGSLEAALEDAIKVTELDPLSYRGYERKYIALHGMRRHKEAFEAFETMLSKLAQCTDSRTLNLCSQYVDATPRIHEIIKETTRDMPRVLIDVTTGNLYDRARQEAAFKKLPVYNELRSQMTTSDRLDPQRIQREVETFYQYVMLSHRWEPDEPTFQMLERTSVYGLPESRENRKLLGFCRLALTLNFRWAWSDTCCVNQADNRVQQESVIAMFRWYRGSSLTVVHLLGVFSDSQVSGCLWRSIWNTRGWTYQEYVASTVVQFYTEDWKPYLGLDMFNHKESPIILSEMEHAMNFTTQELSVLRPGFENAREKLYLASKRKTTREEDMAYSLFGIFNVAIPIIYGEGSQAVGRLLEHILTRSDNVTLLSWTGTSGSHHTYLPSDLSVYDQIMAPHVPRPLEMVEIHKMVSALHSSLIDPSLAVMLYKRLHDLPSLSVAAGRLKLSGIIFPLPNFNLLQKPDPISGPPVYRALTPALGDVWIETKDDLTRMERLVLIHPWICPLLDQDFSCDSSPLDLALRLLVRLRQPFGALLLAPMGRVQYRRVATDSLIMVQIREEFSLTDLNGSVQTVDVQ